MNNIIEDIKRSSDYIINKLGTFRPDIGLILGSGLGVLAESIEAFVVFLCC